MDPLVTVFSLPEYEPLLLALDEGIRNPARSRRNRELVKQARRKETIRSFCTRTELLLTDTELWDIVEKMFKEPYGYSRMMRFRQVTIGNIIKGVFILHKEKAKKFYELCKTRFLNVFQHSFNQKLDKVIVIKKFYPAMPPYLPAVNFTQRYDRQLWDRFYEGSRHAAELPSDHLIADPCPDVGRLPSEVAAMPPEVDTIHSATDAIAAHIEMLMALTSPSGRLGNLTEYSPRAIQLDQAVEERLPRDELPPIDDLCIETSRMDFEYEPLVSAGIRSDQPEFAHFAEETGPQTRRISVPDDIPPVPTPQPIPVTGDVHFPENYMDQPTAIEGDRQADEAMPLDHLIADLRSAEDTAAPSQMDVIEPELPVAVDGCSGQPDPIVGETVQQIRTIVPDVSPPIPAPQPVTGTVDVHLPEKIAIEGDRQADEITSVDHLMADLRPAEDTAVPSQMDVIQHELPVAVDGIRSGQSDPIVEETVQQIRTIVREDSPPVPTPQPLRVTVDAHFPENNLDTPIAIEGDRQADEIASMDHLMVDLRPAEDTAAPSQMEVIELDSNLPVAVDGIRSEQPDLIVVETVQQPAEEFLAETNIEQLQRDFDRIELVSSPRPAQMNIPGIVVTELEGIRTEPEGFPERGLAEELMEGRPRRGRGQYELIRVSDLMREDGSWEQPAPPKRAKKKIPVSFSYIQMKRMIDRPFVKNIKDPLLVAAAYSERRPNALHPLRLLCQDDLSIHDFYGTAPLKYADELNKRRQRESQLTLQQLMPFSHGVIFEKINPSFTGEMTREQIEDREAGRKALKTVVNFKRIPSVVALRFYGQRSPPQTRPSLRDAAEPQQLDIPGVSRRSSVPHLGERQQSLVPDAAIPPRPSIEPFLAGEVFDRNVHDESILLPSLEHVSIAVPEQELNLTAAIREPRLSVPAIEEGLNLGETVEEARPSLLALSHLQTMQEEMPSLPAAHTVASKDDVSHPEVIQQPRPAVEEHTAAAEDVNRIIVAEEPRGPKYPRLKSIDIRDVISTLKSLLRKKKGKVAFLDLCPEPTDEEIQYGRGLTKGQVAATFRLLLEEQKHKNIRLEYEYALKKQRPGQDESGQPQFEWQTYIYSRR